MLAFHRGVWDKALLKGPLISQFLLNSVGHQLRKVRENPDSLLTGKKNLAELWQDPRDSSMRHLALSIALQRTSAHIFSRLDGEAL